MAGAREKNMYMAKLAEKANRYDEMVEFLEKVAAAAAAEGKELTLEERDLLLVAYRTIVNDRRKSRQIVSSTEQEESRGNEDYAADIRDLRAKIEDDLTSRCAGILRLLDASLIPSASAAHSKVFYNKMKGDFHRYLAEFKTGSEREDAAKSALAAYNSAQDIAMAELAWSHPIRLNLCLAFSVFYYRILDSPGQACTLAKQALDGATPEHKESGRLLRRIRHNLASWTPDTEPESADDSDDSDDSHVIAKEAPKHEDEQR
ncbi:14-3-3-like protein 16R [Elaeis guineensis]|uniref:14-3-3-like protein 16R n=1 Tax=Elaeis guineensis var. tenera TaxID=51953 RepID=UPI003C6D19B3